MSTTKKSQRDQVLDHLKLHGQITSWEAIEQYHITRLAEYIRQLRVQGFNISMDWKTNNGKSFGVYTLIPAQEAVSV